MTAPSRPPGLSLSHLPARLALSTPAILRLILTHLSHLHGFGTDALQHSAPPHYSALRSVALVGKAWAEEARRLLHEELHFWGGDGQMQKWLYAVEEMEKRGERWGRNGQVSFCDRLPVVFAEKKGGGRAKWSEEVLVEVMGKLRGVRSLLFGFMRAMEVPAEVLMQGGLKDLKELGLCCPLRLPFDAASRQVPFTLSTLSAACLLPRQSPCGWSSTFSFLSPSLRSLTTLDLDAWHPTLPASLAIEPFFFPSFMPAASTLKTLELPYLALNSSSWRLALFACACVNLKKLVIARAVSAAAIREVLPAFHQTGRLEELVLRKVDFALGTGVVHYSLLEWADPLDALGDVLNKWPDEPIPSSSSPPRPPSPTPSTASSSTLAASITSTSSSSSSSEDIPLARQRSTSPPASRRCTLKRLEIRSVKYKYPSYLVVDRLDRIARMRGVREVVLPSEESGREESVMSEEETARFFALLQRDHDKRQQIHLEFLKQMAEALSVISNREINGQSKKEEGDGPRIINLNVEGEGGLDGWMAPPRDEKGRVIGKEETGEEA